MRKTICLILLFSAQYCFGSDSLRIEINHKNFNTGDTIEFTCTIPDFAALKLKSATLNVWIEDVEKSKRWKFRYPIINGEISASLAISDKIPDGRYAVNFLVQRGFFRISGKILDHDKKDTSVNYFMVQRNKQSAYIDNAQVAPDGSFRLKSTLFADSAFFIFTPTKKVRTNYLSVKIETALDSAFVPVLSDTRFITIGDPKMVVPKKTDTSHYAFKAEETVGTLPNVTVTGKYKSKVQQFDEEYSAGLFKNNDAIIFDGIESEDIARSINVLQFLQGRVPGLTVTKNDVGQDVAKWRNQVADIYIDEFRMDPSDHTLISPTDIAMIKVFRPPAMLSGFSGGAGAIAIYTKRGAYADNRAKHNFVVKGYTSIDSVWE
jgi:hypothetical protein